MSALSSSNQVSVGTANQLNFPVMAYSAPIVPAPVLGFQTALMPVPMYNPIFLPPQRMSTPSTSQNNILSYQPNWPVPAFLPVMPFYIPGNARMQIQSNVSSTVAQSATASSSGRVIITELETSGEKSSQHGNISDDEVVIIGETSVSNASNQHCINNSNFRVSRVTKRKYEDLDESNYFSHSPRNVSMNVHNEKRPREQNRNEISYSQQDKSRNNFEKINYSSVSSEQKLAHCEKSELNGNSGMSCNFVNSRLKDIEDKLQLENVLKIQRLKQVGQPQYKNSISDSQATEANKNQNGIVSEHPTNLRNIYNSSGNVHSQFNQKFSESNKMVSNCAEDDILEISNDIDSDLELNFQADGNDKLNICLTDQTTNERSNTNSNYGRSGGNFLTNNNFLEDDSNIVLNVKHLNGDLGNFEESVNGLNGSKHPLHSINSEPVNKKVKKRNKRMLRKNLKNLKKLHPKKKQKTGIEKHNKQMKKKAQVILKRWRLEGLSDGTTLSTNRTEVSQSSKSQENISKSASTVVTAPISSVFQRLGMKQKESKPDTRKHRPLVIDGANVAFSHGRNKVFSPRGIALAIEYFKKKNHPDIKVFLPSFRKHEVKELIPEEHIVYTPSRMVAGKRITCYEDRFMLEYAEQTGAVVLSNDLFRDLEEENTKWFDVINERILMFTFADDVFLIPQDPHGKNGPTLDDLLKFPD